MVELKANLSNEEAFLMLDVLNPVEEALVKKLRSPGTPHPLDKNAALYATLRRFTVPLRKHVKKIKSHKRR